MVHTFGLGQGLSGCCIAWEALSNVNQVGLNVQQGHFMLQGALRPLGKALEGVTGLQAPLNHLIKSGAHAVYLVHT